MSSKNEGFLVHDLTDLTSQMIFHTSWASMNNGSKSQIAWMNSRYASPWFFYMHCRIEESSSPGIIYISWHQVICYPSQHGNSTMGKHLLAKVHIAKLNELPESRIF